MKNNSALKLLLLWACFTGFLAACTDHSITEPGNPRLRIDRTIQPWSSDQSIQIITEYRFDRDDKPISIRRFLTSDSLRPLEFLTFTYRGSTVIGFERQNIGSDRPEVIGEFQQFELNEKGQVIDRKVYYRVTSPGQPQLVSQDKFEYDSQGNVTQIRNYHFSGARTIFPNPVMVIVSDMVRISPTAIEMRTKGYTSRAVGRTDFSCMECYLTEPSAITLQLERREFDTNLNPFFGRYLINPTLESLERANLVKRERFQDSEINPDWTLKPQAASGRGEYSYVYNADKLPVRQEFVGIPGATIYTYKPY